jgi:hypothetical protein
MTNLRAQAARAAVEWIHDMHGNRYLVPDSQDSYAAGFESGHAAGVADGARAAIQQVHDAMERCIGQARKAKEIARTARLRCEMSAVAGWIAALQEELFINPETRILASRPAPGTGIASKDGDD